MNKQRDHELGMDRPITRRDFLDGTARAVQAVTAGSVLGGGLGLSRAAAQERPVEPVGYPPGLTGDRGHHAGSWEVMHAVRDGTFWNRIGTVVDTDERYDLVVVGAGISGLAAAFLYRQQAGPSARILMLENHDDVGGHAKRNEFTASNGKTLIGYGGSQSLQTPTYFSPAVKQLLKDINIDVGRFKTYYNQEWAETRGLGEAVFFDQETFGVDRLVKKQGDAVDWVPRTPLSETAQRDLIELFGGARDYLPGLTREQKLERLAKTTYADFLTGIVKADPQLVTFFQRSTTAYFGVGVDATNCLDARGNGNPGFDGMDLGEAVAPAMSPSGRLAFSDPDPYIYHFPDGNAGIARSFVRTLIPAALPGSTMEDLVTAPLDYSRLDLADHPVRIRLNATVVRVQHTGPAETADAVEVTYASGGTARRVTAGHVVLACWHRVIPYLTDELPPAQVRALKDQVKVPLVYTNVQLRNWQALARLGITGFQAPGHYWHGAEIDFPVSMGRYRFADTPDDPVVLHLSKVAVEPGKPPREQAQAGRWFLYRASFEEMERQIRDLLGRALGAGGFDPARDIEAITINRWSHGYAYEYMRPWDVFWPDGPLPIEAARQPWGRIAIANADSGAYAYAHSAIDQAARAVRELLGTSEGAPAFADFPGPPREAIGLR